MNEPYSLEVLYKKETVDNHNECQNSPTDLHTQMHKAPNSSSKENNHLFKCKKLHCSESHITNHKWNETSRYHTQLKLQSMERHSHWFPTQQHIYRVAALVRHCLLGIVPVYLQELCRPVLTLVGPTALCSSSGGELLVPV